MSELESYQGGEPTNAGELRAFFREARGAAAPTTRVLEVAFVALMAKLDAIEAELPYG